MTINGSSQTFSFTAVRLSVTERSGPEATSAKPATSTVEPDRATLSSATGTAAARVKRRADALFGALDGDEDGAITEQEFTEGAIALLRRAGGRRRVRGDDGEGAEGESRGVRRLERKLEKAFGRVDANDDGAIDKEELTTALAQVAKRRGGQTAPPPPAEPPPAQEPAPPAQTGTAVSFSFTFVSIAVQRYTSLQSPQDVTLKAAKDALKEPLTVTGAAAGYEPAIATNEPRRAA